MGKSANAELYRKLEQQARRNERDEPEDQREPQYDDWYQRRIGEEIEAMGDWR